MGSISLEVKVVSNGDPKRTVAKYLLEIIEKIENPILQSVIKDRVYQRNDSIGYHDDSTCSYTCHSDHDDS
jgi:hypothetical protein